MIARMRLTCCVILLLLLGACSGASVRADAAASYLLVRHAEKDTAVDPRDPPLTDAGRERAERLAGRLADVRLDAIYSTATRRTRQTAAPIARTHRLAIIDYDAGDAEAFAARLHAEHPTGTVVVVGHSDTLPALAHALCRCAVAAMDEAIYGIRYTVTVGIDGHARLQEFRDP